MQTKKLLRRKSALARLEVQLKSGVKTIKGSVTGTEPLSDKDKVRIEREINVLKTQKTKRHEKK